LPSLIAVFSKQAIVKDPSPSPSPEGNS